MGRPEPVNAGGLVYHVLNRANACLTIFRQEADYVAFEQVLGEAVERVQMRLLAYCLMPDHGHLVLGLQADGDLSRQAKGQGKGDTADIRSGWLRALAAVVAPSEPEISSRCSCQSPSQSVMA